MDTRMHLAAKEKKVSTGFRWWTKWLNRRELAYSQLYDRLPKADVRDDLFNRFCGSEVASQRKAVPYDWCNENAVEIGGKWSEHKPV